MKSRILSLLVAMALVLSLAVPAFAQTGETSEDNNLPDVTDIAELEGTLARISKTKTLSTDENIQRQYNEKVVELNGLKNQMNVRLMNLKRSLKNYLA